ncbi:hypothetical protein KQH49_13480 [Mycetohabitans sp. B5]|nr:MULTISPECIES: hypothetical protein [Mycetohabitans]MCG1055882.1 hypothetical protein [Mycetohabitans sp. B5]
MSKQKLLGLLAIQAYIGLASLRKTARSSESTIVRGGLERKKWALVAVMACFTKAIFGVNAMAKHPSLNQIALFSCNVHFYPCLLLLCTYFNRYKKFLAHQGGRFKEMAIASVTNI